MELEQKDIKNRHQKYNSYECYIEKNPNRTWRGLKSISNEKIHSVEIIADEILKTSLNANYPQQRKAGVKDNNNKKAASVTYGRLSSGQQG